MTNPVVAFLESGFRESKVDEQMFGVLADAAVEPLRQLIKDYKAALAALHNYYSEECDWYDSKVEEGLAKAQSHADLLGGVE